ncbi:MAG: glycogen/starch/alpha-glucan phosphorylase [Massiliimalia sp.]|jgi:starch phosphorylase
MRNSQLILTQTEQLLRTEFCTSLEKATVKQLYYALTKAYLSEIHEDWEASEQRHNQKKRAFYLSAEYLMGRAVFNNLYCLGILDPIREELAKRGVDLNSLEDIEDDALGNGGLGRLAACFLDSAATQNLPLNGYGLRYQYGIFKQYFENGFQKEMPDDWQKYGDPGSVRREDLAVEVHFAGQTVRAVPYDMPIIGYGTKNINTLRLWQSEALCNFDLDLFNDQKYDRAVKERNDAENINKILYPNDSTNAGKKLRLKQQYFFSSASLQDIMRLYQREHGGDFTDFADYYAVQLNDTHPVVSIPELIRLLMQNAGMSFDAAFEVAQKTFAYTNHTIMAEALEKWDIRLFRSVLPEVYKVIKMIDARLTEDLKKLGRQPDGYRILDGGLIHMARMAIYASSATNGVARIHTEILKDTELHNWYEIYPERFQNKTNGITQRRWFGLCNRELSNYVTGLIGDGWIRDLSQLKKLEAFADDEKVLRDFMQIKRQKKEELCAYVKKMDKVTLNPDFIFDIQVKRLHEYKRQLLNAFSIMDLYFQLKQGKLPDFRPTLFLFGAKSAPGYFRAKGIIKYINEIAKLVNNDPDVNEKMAVLFVSNYNVSYAEKIIPAADYSEQISTAGTEASGTSNMKFMLNGAVTLGTYDGANVEIVEQAGEENNYIFGARVEELDELKAKDAYHPKKIYEKNPRIRRVVDTLVDGTFDDQGTGMFEELYHALLDGASWHKPDHYFLLEDFESYLDAKLKLNRDYGNSLEYAKKCWLNMANAGMFSSDRTIQQYADEIWHIQKVEG